MKKITALIVAVMMLLSLAAIPAFAEVTDADYVQDGWGKERELKEGDRWNIQYLFGRETPANGFSFYGKTSEETKLTPTTYKKGGDGAEVQELGEMSFAYYQPHHRGANSVFYVYPTHGEMTIGWTAPQTGNVTFDIEASLRKAQTDEMDGALIKFERANGKALAKALAVTKQGQDAQDGFNKNDVPENAKTSVTFEVKKGETVYIRFTNNKKCALYLDDALNVSAWLTYNRIGENPDNPGTADIASVAVFVGVVALAGVCFAKKKR